MLYLTQVQPVSETNISAKPSIFSGLKTILDPTIVIEPQCNFIFYDISHTCTCMYVSNNHHYHSLYSILNFDWLIYLQITACK